MPVKSKVKILQIFVALSEYMDFITQPHAFAVNISWECQKIWKKDSHVKSEWVIFSNFVALSEDLDLKNNWA